MSLCIQYRLLKLLYKSPLYIYNTSVEYNDCIFAEGKTLPTSVLI